MTHNNRLSGIHWALLELGLNWPYPIAGETRVFRSRFSDRSKIAGSDFFDRRRLLLLALSIALEMSSFAMFPSYDRNFLRICFGGKVLSCKIT